MIDLFNPDKAALIAKWQMAINIIGPHNKWDTHAELAWICEAALQMPMGGRYLEVGSYLGASMKAAMMANPIMYGVTLDTWDDAGSKEAYQALLDTDLASGRLRMFQGPSREGFKLLDGTFDLIFIDGGHLYDDVSGDIRDALRFSHPGTIIAGHDFRPDLPEDGVTKAVCELLPGYKNVVDSTWCYQCP